jgi:hypothetical protein
MIVAAMAAAVPNSVATSHRPWSFQKFRPSISTSGPFGPEFIESGSESQMQFATTRDEAN